MGQQQDKKTIVKELMELGKSKGNLSHSAKEEIRKTRKPIG